MKKLIFNGGHAWGADGRPLSYFSGVVYTWDAANKIHVHVDETLGTGSVYNSRSYEREFKTVEELNSFLHEMKETQAHYKKVYGE